MGRFFSQMARAISHIFAPVEVELVKVGFQPITADIYRPEGSACYASDLEGSDRSDPPV